MCLALRFPDFTHPDSVSRSVVVKLILYLGIANSYFSVEIYKFATNLNLLNSSYKSFCFKDGQPLVDEVHGFDGDLVCIGL